MKPIPEVIAFIESITRESTSATNIDIIELGSLSDLLPVESAEQLRQAFVASEVSIRQLTNHTDLGNWTEQRDLLRHIDIRVIPPETLLIETEVLVFDDTVAWYRLGEYPDYGVTRDQGYADTVRSLFAALWEQAIPTAG